MSDQWQMRADEAQKNGKKACRKMGQRVSKAEEVLGGMADGRPPSLRLCDATRPPYVRHLCQAKELLASPVPLNIIWVLDASTQG